jgi:hypothetical protein
MAAGKQNFSVKTIELLSHRAGSKCSICGCTTWGPTDSLAGGAIMGKAAHITGACEGCLRYDPNMSPERRSSAMNGIWLCANCHDKIDKKAITYSVQELRNLKKSAEEKAKLELGMASQKLAGSMMDSVSVAVSGVAIIEIRKVKSKLAKHHNTGVINEEEGAEILDIISFIDFNEAHYLPEVGVEMMRLLFRLLKYVCSTQMKLEIIRHLGDVVTFFAFQWKKEEVEEFCDSIKPLATNCSTQQPLFQSTLALLKDMLQRMFNTEFSTRRIIADTIMEIGKQRRKRSRFMKDDDGPSEEPSLKEPRIDEGTEDTYIEHMKLLGDVKWNSSFGEELERAVSDMGYEWKIF